MTLLYNPNKDIIPIQILDSVWSKTNKQGATILQHELSYEKVIWIPTAHKKKRKIQTVKMIKSHGNGEFLFHTGFVPRILKFFNQHKITYDYSTDIYPIEYDEPALQDITFWKAQARLIQAALTSGRGVIHSATATGKSIIMAGIISSFSRENILFLVDQTQLVLNMEKHLKKMGFTDIGVWYSKRKEDRRIILATIQSFKSVVIDFHNHFQILLVDEGHHIRNIDSDNYGYTIQRIFAPVKIAVTATLPETKEGQMNLEALIGPVIGTYSIEEATKDKKISKPIVRFLHSPEVLAVNLYDKSTVPCRPEILAQPATAEHKKIKGRLKEKLTKYKIIYYNGIVNNLNRNISIMVEAEKRILKGKSVLIKIIRTMHGDNLMQIANDMGLNILFIHGETPIEQRESIRLSFNAKRVLCVIATDVWKEGIDIPSLETCIIGGGLKSEIATYQNIGRGTRRTKTKATVEIIDFKDKQHKYLKNHYLARYKVCEQHGWIVHETAKLDYYKEK